MKNILLVCLCTGALINQAKAMTCVSYRFGLSGPYAVIKGTTASLLDGDHEDSDIIKLSLVKSYKKLGTDQTRTSIYRQVPAHPKGFGLNVFVNGKTGKTTAVITSGNDHKFDTPLEVCK